MRPFSYLRARTDADALQGGAVAGSHFLSGGTTLVDLAKLDVLRPERVVDVNALQARYGRITVDATGLRLGAMVRMSEAAEHPAVLRDYPVIAQSLALAASQQIRNMASLGGNVLQRTRCSYYRDVSYEDCNKRRPGSGCSAIGGNNRNHAVLGVSDACIASYPGDFGQALAALDATVELLGPAGARVLPFEQLHRPAGDSPNLETNLRPGEMITGFHIPAGAWTRRSLYLKIRDRQSYEFAAASAAVALAIDRGLVQQARIAIGGMTSRPWRARAAEAALVGKALTEENANLAAAAALAGAVTHGHNDFKPTLGRLTLVRALLQTAAMEA